MSIFREAFFKGYVIECQNSVIYKCKINKITCAELRVEMPYIWRHDPIRCGGVVSAGCTVLKTNIGWEKAKQGNALYPFSVHVVMFNFITNLMHLFN